MTVTTTTLKNKKIVLLCGQSDSSPIVYHSLCKHYPIEKVIIEESVPKKTLITRRIKKLGLFTVIGQLIFQVIICKFLRQSAKQKIKQIKADYELDDTPIPITQCVEVNSVNADSVRTLLQAINPDVVVVNGTRIISPSILKCINAPFINMHAGITPRYRGTHGGYWALVENDRPHCGVTVHLVDAGIDTGSILGQATIAPDAFDNFTTYPYLQLAKGLPLLIQAIHDALHHSLQPKQTQDTLSKLWYHPTAWGYLWNRYAKYKVK